MECGADETGEGGDIGNTGTGALNGFSGISAKKQEKPLSAFKMTRCCQDFMMFPQYLPMAEEAIRAKIMTEVV